MPLRLVTTSRILIVVAILFLAIGFSISLSGDGHPFWFYPGAIYGIDFGSTSACIVVRCGAGSQVLSRFWFSENLAVVSSFFVPIGCLIARRMVLAHARILLERDWELRQQKICVKCGYDLRATPDRCPECGTFPQDTENSAVTPHQP
jgi:hypothetical protein